MKNQYAFSLSLPLWLIFGILGYFVYDSIGGALAVILLSITLGLISLLVFIPIVGIFLYYHLGKLVMGKIIVFTAITHTWLTSLIFWLNFALALIISLVTIIILFIWLFSKKRTTKISFRPYRYCKARFTRKEDIDNCLKTRGF